MGWSRKKETVDVNFPVRQLQKKRTRPHDVLKCQLNLKRQKQCRKHDGNAAFLFVSCINVGIVPDISWLHTDLKFLSATVHTVSTVEQKLLWVVKSHAPCRSWFIKYVCTRCTLLHFPFINTSNFLPQPNVKTYFFSKFYSHAYWKMCKQPISRALNCRKTTTNDIHTLMTYDQMGLKISSCLQYCPS